MIILKEEFKEFVRKKPELIRYVNSGKMTWQKFYEQWSLYGEDEKAWEMYKPINKENKAVNKEETFNFASIADIIKKIDMNSVQKGVNGLQKIVELLQGLTAKDAVNTSKGYEPRQLFKKFED